MHLSNQFCIVVCILKFASSSKLGLKPQCHNASQTVLYPTRDCMTLLSLSLWNVTVSPCTLRRQLPSDE
eukprot:COSAG02_NODE_6325_length_3649_cov_3.679155_2_plen_69_part_00